LLPILPLLTKLKLYRPLNCVCRCSVYAYSLRNGQFAKCTTKSHSERVSNLFSPVIPKFSDCELCLTANRPVTLLHCCTLQKEHIALAVTNLREVHSGVLVIWKRYGSGCIELCTVCMGALSYYVLTVACVCVLCNSSGTHRRGTARLRRRLGHWSDTRMWGCRYSFPEQILDEKRKSCE